MNNIYMLLYSLLVMQGLYGADPNQSSPSAPFMLESGVRQRARIASILKDQECADMSTLAPTDKLGAMPNTTNVSSLPELPLSFMAGPDWQSKVHVSPSQSAEVRKKKFFSWQELHFLGVQVAKLLQQKKAEGEPALQTPLRGIVAVACGGLDPASFVVQALKKMPGMLREDFKVDTVCVKSYSKDNKQGTIRITKKARLPVPAFSHADGVGRGWLFVDDLVDSGKTFKELRRIYPYAIYAVLLAKPQGMPFVDIWAQEVPQDTWVEFPWEQEPEYKATRQEGVLFDNSSSNAIPPEAASFTPACLDWLGNAGLLNFKLKKDRS